jgi:hypothetical protein
MVLPVLSVAPLGCVLTPTTLFATVVVVVSPYSGVDGDVVTPGAVTAGPPAAAPVGVAPVALVVVPVVAVVAVVPGVVGVLKVMIVVFGFDVVTVTGLTAGVLTAAAPDGTSVGPVACVGETDSPLKGRKPAVGAWAPPPTVVGVAADVAVCALAPGLASATAAPRARVIQVCPRMAPLLRRGSGRKRRSWGLGNCADRRGRDRKGR